MKINHYKLTILLLLISLSAFAQKDTKTRAHVPYISIEGGIGIPQGYFKKSLSIVDPNGLALLGVDFNASISYPIYNTGLELEANLGYTMNKFDLNTFVQFLDAPSNPISSTAYTTGNLIGGLGYEFRLNKSFSLNIKVLAGALLFSSPDVQYSKLGRGNYDVQPANCISPVIKYGMGLLYNISNKFATLLNVNVMSSSPLVTPTVQVGPGNIISYTEISPMEFFLVEANIGIAYHFSK